MWKRLPTNGRGFGPGSGGPLWGFDGSKRTRPKATPAMIKPVRRERVCDIRYSGVTDTDNDVSYSVHAKWSAVYIAVGSMGR